MTVFAYTSAEAQAKKAPALKEKETCNLSADHKYVTCCKTTLNPAYDVKGKTVAVKPKKQVKKTAGLKRRTVRTYYAKNYQVCKDEGGYYTCCLYENNTTNTATMLEPNW